MNYLIRFRFFLLAAVAVATFGCQGQSSAQNGYQNLDTLYADFVRCLKAGGEDLKQYCFKICPDEATVSYMEKNGVNYRGIPDELKKRDLKVTIIGEKYFEEVQDFRRELAGKGQLDNLVYIGREEPGEQLFDERLKVYGTETFILLKSGTDTISCKLGEMFNFGGVWKSFTSPKLGW